MIHLGFTGTRKGMTDEQLREVNGLVYEIVASKRDNVTAHHGDCIGADADFHRLVRLAGCLVHLHPPDDPKHRAFCDYDVSEQEIPYLDRNEDIVNASQWMIATPDGYENVVRSGTWSTIRYTKSVLKLGTNSITSKLAIVYPDGTREFNGRTIV